MFSEAERSELILWQAVGRGRQRQPVQTREAPSLSSTDARRRMLQRPTSMTARDPSHVDLGTNDFEVEDIEYKTEEGSQGWVPLKIIRPAQKVNLGPFPVAILLHPTGANKEFMVPMMAKFAKHGYLTASIDCRYHGSRALRCADQRDLYEKSLVRAWKDGEERPFLLDNVWDLIHLLDYLETRPDVDPHRIGMSGS
ncbi:hypothetical protein BSKO_03616 [Bryopsis sp. KO-2023]|nr:hypothetical protein BSKO_03616 [Bryopsis sp. KO-2023]